MHNTGIINITIFNNMAHKLCMAFALVFCCDLIESYKTTLVDFWLECPVFPLQGYSCKITNFEIFDF